MNLEVSSDLDKSKNNNNNNNNNSSANKSNEAIQKEDLEKDKIMAK
jgi:hypothetical protein